MLVLGLTAALCLVSAPVASGSFPGRNGLLAVGGDGFTFRCREMTIHVVRADGSGVRRLSPTGGCGTFRGNDQRWAPEWSAAGTELLFRDFTESERGVMTTGGSDVGYLNLPQHPSFGGLVGLPSYSPAGDRSALARQDDNRVDMWIVARDGRAPRRVHMGQTPRWSPDGRTIAYTTPFTQHPLNGRLGLLDLATERSTPVRRFSGRVKSIDWSPDGRRLLLVLEPRGDGNNRLATVVAGDRTSRPIRIALPRRFRSRLNVEQAVWSPDGRRIAFTAYRVYQPPDNEPYIRSSLWVMSARGGHVKRLVGLGPKASGEIPNSVSWQPVLP